MAKLAARPAHRERRRSSFRQRKFKEVLVMAEREGLLDGGRTQVVRGRMPEALVSQAKKRTGIKSDTDLIEVALANIAVGDDYADGCFHSEVRSILRSILSSELWRSIRRYKPERHTRPLQRRTDSELDFLETIRMKPAKLLYDTTVYIDVLRDQFPMTGQLMLASGRSVAFPGYGSGIDFRRGLA